MPRAMAWHLAHAPRRGGDAARWKRDSLDDFCAYLLETHRVGHARLLTRTSQENKVKQSETKGALLSLLLISVAHS